MRLQTGLAVKGDETARGRRLIGLPVVCTVTNFEAAELGAVKDKVANPEEADLNQKN